jgi:ABC-2 type transport system ATP-binding protein
MDIPTLEIQNLSKNFGSYTAVREASFAIHPGTICALVGENGAGKTTLVKLIVGLLIPSEGIVKIGGYDIQKNPVEAKKLFGYMPDNPESYDYLSGFEFLEFTARLRSMKREAYEKRLKVLQHLFPIEDILSLPISEYSRGNKQKVAFLASLLSEPPLLLIDEPIVGLDPPSIDIFGKTLVSYAKTGHAVLFVTHILSFAREYSKTIVRMHKGVLENSKPTQSIKNWNTLISL